MQPSAPPAGLVPLGGRPRLRDYLGWMWQRREFSYHLASSTFRSQHMDTLLGNLWQLINPVLLIGVYYLVFGVLLGNLGGDALPWRPANYIGFLSVGVFVYSYLQRCVTAGASSIVGNLGLIRSLQFPRAVLPVSTVTKEVLGFGSSLVVMLLVMVVSGEGVSATWLAFPAVFVLMTAFALGGAFITARMTESVRDLRNLLPFVFRLGFYVSGILYDITRFTADRPSLAVVEELFLLNPFYVYIALTRQVLMSTHGHATPGRLWVAATLWAVVALTFGLHYFLGAEKRYGRG